MAVAYILLLHYIVVKTQQSRCSYTTFIILFLLLYDTVFYWCVPLLAVTRFYILCSMHSEHMHVMRTGSISSVVPECIHERSFNERVHILGECELNGLSSCPMNVTVKVLVLASVNGTLIQFICVQLGGKTHRKPALMCSGKTPNLATPACSVALSNASIKQDAPWRRRRQGHVPQDKTQLDQAAKIWSFKCDVRGACTRVVALICFYR